MKVLFLSRATLYSVFGGDTVQVDATARYLRQLGVEVDIRLCNETIDYGAYDLLHIFNVIRPADTIRHVRASGKPYVLSTIYVDFSEYEKRSRKGLAGLATRLLRRDQQEYLKAILRGVLNGERIQSPEYWWLGHRKAVQQLAKGAAVLLPNSGVSMSGLAETIRSIKTTRSFTMDWMKPYSGGQRKSRPGRTTS